MKIILIFFTYLFSASFLFAQTEKGKINSYNLSAKFGVGVAKFAVTGFDTEDYTAMVTRMGVGVAKAVIDERVFVESGLIFYFRAKSKSPLVDDIHWYGKGTLLIGLHETATRRNIAIEIPIIVSYLFRGDRSLNTGLIVRQYGPKELKEVTLLSSQTELGYTLGIKQQVIKGFSIGVDVYIGLKDYYHRGVVGSGGDIKVKNRSALFSVAYDF